MKTTPKSRSLIVLGMVFSLLAASDGALAAVVGPIGGGGGGVRGPSINMTPRINPNFHYDRTKIPGEGDKNPKGSSNGNDRPRRIIKFDNGPIGPIGPIGPSGPTGTGSPAARRITTPATIANAVPDEVLITVNAGFTEAAANRLAQTFRLSRLESQTFQLTNIKMFRWRVPPDGRSIPAVMRALANAGFTVQPNHLFKLSQSEGKAVSEGDPAQYTVSKLRLPAAHGLARGGSVLVSVIDSGVDVKHPELEGVIADSFDAAGVEPPHTHGTAIAGAIASHARLIGSAPAARILAVRAFGTATTGADGTTFNILKSLEWSAGKGARIINMSFAGPRDASLEKALAAAKQKGIVLIAASGNAGPKSPPLYPAADPNVIAVSATDADDKLFAASNRGPYIAVAAPGVDILLPAPDAAYQVTSGTSFAAAYVSGVAALLLERNPSLTPDAVRKILMTSAKDIGPKGRDDQFGAGLVDAFSAVTAAEPKTTTASGQPAQ
jgi:subtilisin family serine protease